MRNLREKLKAVTSGSTGIQRQIKPIRRDPFYIKEYSVPLDELCGVEDTSLSEIVACDPSFSGTSWELQKLLFLDTETTGLSGGAGTIAFEIGVGYIEDAHMVIRQYVMRDYGEEAAMLADLASLISRFDTLVTFNGKTFDIPLLESRMIMQRIRMSLTQMPHFDLLHACRRVYKLRLRRCNLASLEEAVLGQTRSNDLPGALVPQRYFDYLKTQDFSLLHDVLRHNMQDVKSLAILTSRLCEAFRNPEKIVHAEDLFSIGRTLEKGGYANKARFCYKILGHSSMSSQAHMRLSSSYKKERDWEQALSSWQSMIACGEGGTWPYIEMAKYYEHIAREPDKALSYASAALSHELNTMALYPCEQEVRIDALHKRIDRLMRKRRQRCNQREELI